MKNRAAILFIFLVTSVSGRAQEPCTAEMLAAKPGILRESKLRGSTGGLAPADITRARVTLGKIHQSVAAAYKPMGLIGDHSYSFNGGTNAGTFGYRLYLLKYNCEPTGADRTKFYIANATPTVVRVDGNIVHSLDLSAADPSDNTFRGYMFIRHWPEKRGGFYYLGDNQTAGGPATEKAYTWLVTYDDKLPFKALTRKEFLLITKARLEKTKAANGSNGKFYDQYLDRVDEHLRMPEGELGRAAIIYRPDEELFTGFVEAGSRGAYYAIRHDPTYYRNGLPKSAAQFFTVVYNVDESDPVYVRNIQSVQKTLDLNLLRGMLGK